MGHKATLRMESPFLRLRWMHLSAETKYPNEAQDHFPRKRDIEHSLAASLGLRDVQCSPSKIDVFGLGLLQSSGSGTHIAM